MPNVNVLNGSAARAIHVRQILNWLRGVPANSEAVSFTGVEDSSNFALTVLNNDRILNKAFLVKQMTGSGALTRDVFEISGGVITMRPLGSSSTILSVRNFADDADVFTITTDGASLGTGGDVVTTAATQTLTNKTLTTPNLTTPLITSGLKLAIGTAGADPSTNAVLYYLTATNDIRYKAGSNTERVLVDTAQVQTLLNKSLTGVVITDFLKITQTTAPTGVVGSAHVYSKITPGTLLYYKSGSDTERTVVDTDSAQTLTNKTFGAGQSFTTPTITGAVIPNYEDFTEAGIPTSPSSTLVRLYYRSDGSFYYKNSSGTISQVFTDNNSVALATKSFTRMLSLGTL